MKNLLGNVLLYIDCAEGGYGRKPNVVASRGEECVSVLEEPAYIDTINEKSNGEHFSLEKMRARLLDRYYQEKVYYIKN